MTKCVRIIQLFYVNTNPFTLRRTITPFKISINTFLRIAFIELTTRYFYSWNIAFLFSLLMALPAEEWINHGAASSSKCFSENV